MRKFLCRIGLHNFVDYTVTLRTEHRGDMEELHAELYELYEASEEDEHGMLLDAIHGIVVEMCKDCGKLRARPAVLDRLQALEFLPEETDVPSYVSYDEVYLKKVTCFPEPEFTLTL
jgi:hypothetical protein